VQYSADLLARQLLLLLQAQKAHATGCHDAFLVDYPLITPPVADFLGAL